MKWYLTFKALNTILPIQTVAVLALGEAWKIVAYWQGMANIGASAGGMAQPLAQRTKGGKGKGLYGPLS